MRNFIMMLMVVAFTACQSGNQKQESKEEVQVVEATINISGMHCDNCVRSIEKGINEVEGIAQVAVSLNDSNAIVKYNAAKTDLAMIEKAIEKRGFSVKAQ